MAEPFLSEIRIMSFVFAPKGWALCNGQLLPINQNQALFSLLGTTYRRRRPGELRAARPAGRAPIHVGSGHTLGERGGEQAHTLSIAEIADAHARRSRPSAATQATPQSERQLSWQRTPTAVYHAPTSLTSLQPGTVTNVGGSQAHLNMQPFLTLNFCIALQGIFPSPELRRHDHGTTICRRDPDVRRQLRSGRLDVLRGPAAADLRERDALPADRHDLRRRRRDAPSRCPICAGAFRSIRATASSWPRPAAPRRSR